MGLSDDDRRALINLWCQVAWADGEIVEAERKRVYSLLERLGAGSVSAEELETWLKEGAPELSATLPEEAREIFLREAVGFTDIDDLVVG